MGGKPIVTGIIKSNFESQYILNKDCNISRALFNFFVELGFDERDQNWTSFFINKEYYKNNGENKFVSFGELEDFRYNLDNDLYDIDVFFGHRKVFLVIRTEKDMQQEIAEKLFKFVKINDGD